MPIQQLSRDSSSESIAEDLPRLVGYSPAGELLSLVDGGRDPIIAVRPEFEKPISDWAEG